MIVAEGTVQIFNMNNIPMVKNLYDAYKAGSLPHKGAGIYECYFTEGHREVDSRCWITYEFIEKSIKLHEKLNNKNDTTVPI